MDRVTSFLYPLAGVLVYFLRRRLIIHNKAAIAAYTIRGAGMNFKRITFFFTILLILGAVLCTSILFGNPNGEPDDSLQTDSSAYDMDIVMAGCIGQSGEWIYYTNYKDDRNLYRIRKDGHDNTKIAEGDNKYLGISSEYIYYTSGYNDGCRLYRISPDGSREKVSDESFYSASIYGNQIYYTHKVDSEDGAGIMELFRMKTDGTSISRITSDIMNPVVGGGRLFFISPYDECLYITSLNAAGSIKLTNNNVRSIYPYEDLVYYIHGSETCCLWSVRFDGTDDVKIADVPEGVNIINVYENHIYYEDERKGIYRVDSDGSNSRLICYSWNVPVKNWKAWGVNAYETGEVLEELGGFVPLYKVLDYIACYEIPGYKLAGYEFDSLYIKDAMDIQQVEELKREFSNIIYIYPAGMYQSAELIQGRFIVGVKETDEAYLENVLEYLSARINNRPLIVVFTTMEKEAGVTINTIGYVDESGKYIQSIDSSYSNEYDKSCSEELTQMLNSGNDLEKAGNNDSPGKQSGWNDCIYINGIYDSSHNIYFGEAGIYIYENTENNENRKPDGEESLTLVNKLIDEVRNKYGRPWLNVVLYYCTFKSGDLLGKEVLAAGYRLPNDGYTRILIKPDNYEDATREN